MSFDALKSLHTAIIDAQRGYDEAAKDAETGELRRFFEEMSALHRTHHDELHELLVSEGGEADDGGSFMGTIHTTVVSARSAITGLKSALPSFASGEEQLIKKYDEAIDEAETPARALLDRQRAALMTKISEMKAMAARD